jgi:hypothetical protein
MRLANVAEAAADTPRDEASSARRQCGRKGQVSSRPERRETMAMTKKSRGSKGRGGRRGQKRPVKDLAASQGGAVQGGAQAPGKLTFGAPAPREGAVDPSDPSTPR